jgi:hypothetical protein
MKPDDILTIPGARIQVQIKEDTPQGQYHDSLYFTPEEWEKLEPKDIDEHKRTRVNNWVAFVTEQSSKPPYVPTKAELLENQDRLQEQLDRAADSIIAGTASKVELQAVARKLQETLNKINVAATAKPVGK